MSTISERYTQTDRRTIYDRNTALCTKLHRAVKTTDGTKSLVPTQSAATTLVNSFIVAIIDYCNSLLAGCGQQQIDKLQRVMNCAARVIYTVGHN